MQLAVSGEQFQFAVKPPVDYQRSDVARHPIVIDDFDNGRKRHFHDLTVSAFDFNAGRCERVRSLHAADDAAHTNSLRRYDFDISLVVQRLQRCQCFCYFHDFSVSVP